MSDDDPLAASGPSEVPGPPPAARVDAENIYDPKNSILCNETRKKLVGYEKENCNSAEVNNALRQQLIWPTVASGRVATDMVYTLQNKTKFIDSKKMIAIDPSYKANLMALSLLDNFKEEEQIEFDETKFKKLNEEGKPDALALLVNVDTLFTDLNDDQKEAYLDILKTANYIAHEMYNANEHYVAFSKPYDKISFPLLADHQALAAKLYLSNTNDIRLMVSSAAGADNKSKGWINLKSKQLLTILGSSSDELTKFSDDIGKPFTIIWFKLCKQWMKGDPISDEFKKKLQDFKEGDAALLEQLFKEDDTYKPEDKNTDKFDTEVEGNLSRLYRNAIYQYKKIIDSQDPTQYDQVKKDELNKIGDGGILLNYEQWKKNLTDNPGKLLTEGVIERGIDGNKVSQASILDGQPTGGWIFGNQSKIYTELDEMKKMYGDALTVNDAHIMIINENFHIEKNFDDKGAGGKQLKKITKNCGVILAEEDIKCSEYKEIKKDELYKEISSVSGEITFIKVGGHRKEDNAPIPLNFLILNWHGGSTTATLEEMNRLFKFCDKYNGNPQVATKIEIICGDSNITKYKQDITAKEAIISCKPNMSLIGGENYSDKKISKYRWRKDCDKDILLNNQWNKAGPNPDPKTCTVEAEEDGMFLVSLFGQNEDKNKLLKEKSTDSFNKLNSTDFVTKILSIMNSNINNRSSGENPFETNDLKSPVETILSDTKLSDILKQIKSIIHWCSTVKYNYSLSSNNIYNYLETLKTICYTFTDKFLENADMPGFVSNKKETIFISLEEYRTSLWFSEPRQREAANSQSFPISQSFRFGYENYTKLNENKEFERFKDTIERIAKKMKADMVTPTKPITILIYSDILSNISNENFVLNKKKDSASVIISSTVLDLLNKLTNIVGEGTDSESYIISSKNKEHNPDWKSKLIQTLDVDHCIFADDKDWNLHKKGSDGKVLSITNDFGSIPKDMCISLVSKGNKATLLDIYLDDVVKNTAKFTENMGTLYNYYFINYIANVWCTDDQQIVQKDIVKKLKLLDLISTAFSKFNRIYMAAKTEGLEFKKNNPTTGVDLADYMRYFYIAVQEPLPEPAYDGVVKKIEEFITIIEKDPSDDSTIQNNIIKLLEDFKTAVKSIDTYLKNDLNGAMILRAQEAPRLHLSPPRPTATAAATTTTATTTTAATTTAATTTPTAAISHHEHVLFGDTAATGGRKKSGNKLRQTFKTKNTVSSVKTLKRYK